MECASIETFYPETVLRSLDEFFAKTALASSMDALAQSEEKTGLTGTDYIALLGPPNQYQYLAIRHSLLSLPSRSEQPSQLTVFCFSTGTIGAAQSENCTGSMVLC